MKRRSFFSHVFRILRYVLVAMLLLSLLYRVVMPVSAVMLFSALRGDGMQRAAVPIAAISPNLIRAVLASEDGRFCEHHGVDWVEADKAFGSALERGKPGRGASTIPMQVARNLFLSNARFWIRKAVEIPIALGLDALWPKSRMLEIYLNIAQWGKGLFGIEAASWRYFGKSAAQLTPYEAALLATTLPDPESRNPAHPGLGHRRLAEALLARAHMQPMPAHCVARR